MGLLFSGRMEIAMTKKIFRSIITVAMTVLLASIIIATSFVYDYFNKSQVGQLKEQLSLVTSAVNSEGAAYFDNLESSVFRFTLIAPDGKVIADTEAELSKMDNHLNREEVIEALKLGEGGSARYSSTLTEKTLYEAVLLKNGNVLRVSVNRLTLGALIIGMIPIIFAIILVALVVSMLLSDKMAKGIVRPLNEIDLENPSDNDIYEELAPMLAKISKQHKQISHQSNEIRRKTDEFEQITATMNEGLVLLDKKGFIVSMNRAAEKMFGINETPIGCDILTIDRSEDMSQAVELALKGKHSEFREQRNGGEYQFSISSIESSNKTVGAVILCFDVTETVFAERNRREFTANVSHELKTPLQSIIGSAELLENGLVKPEDTDRFVGNIKNEAERLVSLVNDVIRLSQLDENGEAPAEQVDLFDVGKEVLDVLSVAADKRGIELRLNGTSCVISGIRRYLYEILYNLCDNAIRYNIDGGSVTINICKNAGHAQISVADTGIGIPPEHHSRVFERFYRVDKSHSRATGGTGLGLSIVKHAVSYHRGTIKLESSADSGTTVTIIF